MPRRHRNPIAGYLVILLLVAFVPRDLSATHSWSGYHWDGEALPVGIDVGNNVSNEWTQHLIDAVGDWNAPTEGAVKSIDLTVVAGSTDPSTCDPVLGRIEVCNAAYGETGWLGIAQVWAYRGKDKHIAQATTLLNDTYFADPFYDTDAWRQMVTCQEIAHDFGLDHQDEDFYNQPNLGTCMDYTAAPEGGGAYGPANTQPNQHDFDQIETTYAHIAGGGGGGGKPGGGGGGGGGRGRQGAPSADLPQQALPRVPIDSPGEWGQLIRDNGRSALYELELSNNVVLFTFVTWAR